MGAHASGMRPQLLLCLLAVAGCGGSESTTPSPPGNLDPNVPPVTVGSWYQPAAATTWQWQLDGTVNLSYAVDLYDLDLFTTDSSVAAALHGAGRKLVCYFSAGSFESWRPDAGRFTPSDKGGNVPGWPGERWLDIRSANVQAVMLDRLDLAVARGCDGVEPDWLHNFQSNTGFPITATDQLAYNRFLANAARTRGLGIALKNDLDQIPQLVAYFDFAVNEQCHEFDECDVYGPFHAAGKPVFNAEYKKRWHRDDAARERMCATSRAMNMRSVVYPKLLNGKYRDSCD